MPCCENRWAGPQHWEMFHSNEIFHGILDANQIKGMFLWLRQGYIQGSSQGNSSSSLHKPTQSSLEHSNLIQMPFLEWTSHSLLQILQWCPIAPRIEFISKPKWLDTLIEKLPGLTIVLTGCVTMDKLLCFSVP